MATIPGSHFVATPAGQPVNVVETTTTIGSPPTVPGAFNLEFFVSGIASTAAPGYQGLAVLSPGGLQLDLISGAFALTDNGTDNDTLNAFGANETIIGSSAGVTPNLFDPGETAPGGSGRDVINVFGSSNTINGGTGNDPINFIGFSSQINQGSGSDTINVIGSSDTVTAGANGGANQGLVNFGGDTVVGFVQTAGDRIHLTADTVANAVAHSTLVSAGTDTLITLSDGSTILLKGVTHIDSSFFS